jgi:hypothetical protein
MPLTTAPIPDNTKVRHNITWSPKLAQHGGLKFWVFLANLVFKQTVNVP